MALLRYAAQFDPFLSLNCAPTLSALVQSKEGKRSNFAIWQPWLQSAKKGVDLYMSKVRASREDIEKSTNADDCMKNEGVWNGRVCSERPSPGTQFNRTILA